MSRFDDDFRILTVLLVEDNAAHARLVKRSIEDLPDRCEIRHVKNGEVALDYLLDRGEFAGDARGPRPQLVILDLRLPRIDGIEVLRQVKSSKTLMTIPVVVLAASSDREDILRAYKNHANSYLVKPSGLANFSRVLGEIFSYWLGLNVWHQTE